MKDDVRIHTLLSILEKDYPNAHIMLTYQSPWELLVAVMLSAQCTDKMVNSVTPLLFSTYPTIQDIASASNHTVETLVKKTGFYKNKAKNIIAAAKRINAVYKGEVPKTMESLLTIKGVARKTANVVLSNAFNVTKGIAVDTHVIRLSQRLRLVSLPTIGGKTYMYTDTSRKTIDFIKDAIPEKIESELQQLLPKEKWNTITYQLIEHGRAVCRAVHPLCQTCALAQFCPAKRT
ncbi:MAG: endonuclease III [Microgenomates group bacterium]